MSADLTVGKGGYKVICIRTMKESKKTWKTYAGAERNLKSPTEMICSPDGIEWMKRHPEWAEERQDAGGFTKTTGQGICSNSCRRTLAEAGIV